MDKNGPVIDPTAKMTIPDYIKYTGEYPIKYFYQAIINGINRNVYYRELDGEFDGLASLITLYILRKDVDKLQLLSSFLQAARAYAKTKGNSSVDIHIGAFRMVNQAYSQMRE